MTEPTQIADYVRLLQDALPYVVAAANAWNTWAGELDNRRYQEAAQALVDRIRTHIDG